MFVRTAVSVLAILTLALGVAACGGDDGDDGAAAEPTTAAETTTEEEPEDDGGGGGETIQLAADPGGDLAFDTTELSAAAGPITIEFTNDASIPHNVSVEGTTSETVSGGSTTLDLDLEAGEYEFICAVSGHAAGGMTGTLTVE